MTIHITPKRSATMPKRGEKKVLAKGICTFPPSPSAAKTRSASAALSTATVSPKPWKFGFPVQWPSEARTCDLLLRSGRAACGVGALLEAHEHGHLGADGAAIEFGRFLGPAVEEQVRLDLHDVSSHRMGIWD